MRLTIIIITAFVLFSFAALHADTINIPADYPTIQAGIDAAVNGDTVLVAPGTYEENIDFLGKAITVKSIDGAETTIIDGRNPPDPDYGSVVTFSSGEGLDSVLIGFTLTYGTGNLVGVSGFDPQCGGGIFCSYSSPTIMKNTIRYNSVIGYGDGGGICCWKESSPIITDNVIIWNQAGDYGGGIACYDKSSPTITYNAIIGNRADYKVGGIICWKQSSPIIANNVISENTTVTHAGGIGCYESTMIIANNIITRNSADLSAGGIDCWYSSPTITNNVVAGNTAGSTGGGIIFWESTPIVTNNVIVGNITEILGGGILCFQNCYPLITNTIIWDNYAPEGPEIWIGGGTHAPSTVKISHCDVKGGQAQVYVESGCAIDWGPGMIDTDPLFVDPADNDYHLTFNSPCRGSGDNTVSGLPEYDFEGDPRIYQGTVDIGADEFYTHLYITGDQTPGGDIEVKLIGLPGTYPVAIFAGSGIRTTPVPTPYGNFWLLPPWSFMSLGMPIPANGILIIPTTIPVSPPAPYDIPLQGLVGLNSDSLTNLCVLEVR